MTLVTPALAVPQSLQRPNSKHYHGRLAVDPLKRAKEATSGEVLKTGAKWDCLAGPLARGTYRSFGCSTPLAYRNPEIAKD
jgi:hypothetical protein